MKFDYHLMSIDELRRRREYDVFLMKQPSIHTVTHKKISEDRKNCEKELEKRNAL